MQERNPLPYRVVQGCVSPLKKLRDETAYSYHLIYSWTRYLTKPLFLHNKAFVFSHRWECLIYFSYTPICNTNQNNKTQNFFSNTRCIPSRVGRGSKREERVGATHSKHLNSRFVWTLWTLNLFKI